MVATQHPAVFWRRRTVAFVFAVAVVVGVGAGATSIGRALVGTGGDRSLTVVSPGAAPAPAAEADPGGAAGVQVVGAGDTLWSIAREIHTGGDIRATVDRLQAANGGGILRVGQEIVLD